MFWNRLTTFALASALLWSATAMAEGPPPAPSAPGASSSSTTTTSTYTTETAPSGSTGTAAELNPKPFTTNPEAPAVTTGKIALPARRISPQAPPIVEQQDLDRRPFEFGHFPPAVLLRQLSPVKVVPPEALISPNFLKTRDPEARALTLKEAIYLSLQNNPGIQAARLDPLASLEGLRGSEAAFDPDIIIKGDIEKFVTPTTSVLQTGGATSSTQKIYDWNLGVNKLLRATNGTMGVTFNNNRNLTNSTFSQVNPNYNPALTISLNQPLLRNFGWDFATINVRIAETNQKQSQFTYEQQLSDFVLRVISDYWNVVRAEENLQVARDGLNLARDLVRQNEISVRVGVMAPIAVREAQSEAATREAAVFQAEDVLIATRATLRQDVMLNPSQTFIPAPIEVLDRPNPSPMTAEEEQSLELAMEYRPELASMREAIRSMLLQVKYAENQTLPQLTIGSQIGITATAGSTKCSASAFSSGTNNCLTSSAPPPTPPSLFNGNRLPFGGEYHDALERMFSFTYYNYAMVVNIEQPLDNDASKSALAQTRIEYEQQRLRYRDLISQVVVDVEKAIADVQANYKSSRASEVATTYALESLRAEEERYKVGMATTHELLQFQDTLVAARGNQVQAEVNFEISKANLRHSQGVLLRGFNIEFQPEEPSVKRWYTYF